MEQKGLYFFLWRIDDLSESNIGSKNLERESWNKEKYHLVRLGR
jgi:hypothetical protein